MDVWGLVVQGFGSLGLGSPGPDLGLGRVVTGSWVLVVLEGLSPGLEGPGILLPKGAGEKGTGLNAGASK